MCKATHSPKCIFCCHHKLGDDQHGSRIDMRRFPDNIFDLNVQGWKEHESKEDGALQVKKSA